MFVFPFVSIRVWKGKGGYTWKRLAHGRIGELCDDIYSCFLSQSVAAGAVVVESSVAKKAFDDRTRGVRRGGG